jgi:ribosomal protein L7/L12
MSNITTDLNTVEGLIAENQGNDRVILAALKLQLALLALGTKRVKEKMKEHKRYQLIDGLTWAEVEKARDPDGKIPAIKMVRERLMKDGKPFGLKEAKDLVEGWMQKHLGFINHPVTQTESRFDSNGQPW